MKESADFDWEGIPAKSDVEEVLAGFGTEPVTVNVAGITGTSKVRAYFAKRQAKALEDALLNTLPDVPKPASTKELQRQKIAAMKDEGLSADEILEALFS